MPGPPEEIKETHLNFKLEEVMPAAARDEALAKCVMLPATLPGRIELESSCNGGPDCLGLAIYLQGYGTSDTLDGQGATVLLELHVGSPRLVVWADIESQEPTHIIDLKQARELLRTGEPL